MQRFRATLKFYDRKEYISRIGNFHGIMKDVKRLLSADRTFCNENWDFTFDNHNTLHVLSSSHPDHCLLPVANQFEPRHPTPFKFENFWTCGSCFQEIVKQAWNKLTHRSESFHRLGYKLYTMTFGLWSWSRSIILDAWLNFHMGQEIILRLNMVQENKSTLGCGVFKPPYKLKKRLMG